ncbi:sensor histidine kinase [Thiohalomonas denitrificans]|uniref:histidine kinase n=1 Tax=Thiohalomonas denitrificans TaxID=415747 RepID=A0A1G5Q9H6_9GAMM|nr:MASE1 domain-containing protein [Thiohalomonas denitrificans]SCZ57929.1 Bacteriophytochrome (light-regulated signal transduction histidine kinase) [Thiohalomonas denitrificans]
MTIALGKAGGAGALRYLAAVSLFAIVYFVTGQVGLIIQTGHAGVTPLWPASGVALVVCLLFGSVLWPGILVAVVALGLVNGVPLPAALGASVGNILEPVLGARWLRGFRVRKDFGRFRDVIAFGLFAALAPTFVAAAIGSLAMAIQGAVPWSDAGLVWLMWWLGNATGVMVIAPLLLTWRRWPTERLRGWSGIELLFLLAAQSLLVWLSFGYYSEQTLLTAPFFYMIIPFTVWAAVRFGVHGATLSSFLVAAGVLWWAYQGVGLFASPAGLTTVSFEIALILVTTFTGLVVAALFCERTHAEALLRRSHQELERRVHERTRDLERTSEQLRDEIDERKQAENALRRESEKLQRVNADLEEFSAVASHDLKAPLRGVANLAYLIEDELADGLDPENRKRLQLLSERVQRMSHLIDGLLRYARVGHGEGDRVPVALDPFLDELLLHLDLSKNFSIERQTPLPTIIADPLHLEQIFQNLIVNAVHHHDRDTGTISFSAHDEGSGWVLEIADDGPGIPQWSREQIFRMFSSGGDRGHTGIGLAVIRKLVVANGGDIDVVDNQPRGTRFQIRWPK